MLTQAATFQRLTDHRMHNRTSKPTKGRLKKFSYLHQSKIRERIALTAGSHARTHQTHTAVSCWKGQKFQTILTCIPGTERKAAQSDPERGSTTLEHISANYPEEWTQVYIGDLPLKPPGMEVDGSTSNINYQKKRISRWRLGGTLQTSKQNIWH